MNDNPIVEEVHRIREEMLASYGGDLHALVKDMQRRDREAAESGRRAAVSPARPPEVQGAESKKAG